MEIKLNKELQKKLDDFLEIKDAKMQEFLEILDLNEFTFSQDEINQVEKIYKENEDLDLYEYTYIYRRSSNKGFRRVLVYRKV